MCESFKYMDRGWDVRVLENQSPRSVFLWVLALLFMLGALTIMMVHQFIHLHRFDWSGVFLLPICALGAFRYARIIYRRLER